MTKAAKEYGPTRHMPRPPIPSNVDALHDLSIQLAQDGQADAARRYLRQFVETAPRGLYAKDIDKISALPARLK